MKNFFNVIKDNDLENDNYFKYKGSKAMYLLNDYLTRKKRYTFALEIYKENLQDNPKVVLFLNEIYLQINKPAESLKLIANYLQNQSNSLQLLYTQAINLYKYNKLNESFLLSSQLVNLNSTNFEIWVLLARIFLKYKNFEYVLVLLNHAAENIKRGTQEAFEYNTFPKENNEYLLDKTRPKQCG